MTVRPLPTLVLVLCAASALARPDCNACFMKNAAKDLAHQPSPSAPTQGTATEPTPPTGPARGSASPSKGGEAAAAARPDPLVRAKRTAHAAAASWDHVDRDADHNVQIQNRLRDALLAESATPTPPQDSGGTTRQWTSSTSLPRPRRSGRTEAGGGNSASARTRTRAALAADGAT
ncbi:uncharacterized protein LOC117646132 [Thrips palmi]|uniref:Uncharacterized protein LOC117646132 n=1 Tax=Thrips palmi TaxID=161013 RepID=A0A6P8YRU2_THRPL|nr:uncharacterized protein LOC117646132 [Thrips palmi]